MAGVQKRVRASGTTTYVVRWYAADGTERSKGGFRTRKDAKAFAAKADAETMTGMDFDPGKGKMLFRHAAAIWLESRKADTRNNAENHRYALAPAATRRGDGKTLGIDAVFGGYPLNKITREYIQAWVNRLTEAGKKPSTVRHAFWTVRMVLEQAVVDGRLAKSPAEYIKLPTETGKSGGQVGVVVDRAMFLTPAQVSALVDATPWPYNVLIHVAAWAGLRAAELGGLTTGNVELPDAPLNPNAPAKPGVLRVQQAARPNGAAIEYGPLKTKQSYRRVPLTAETTELLRDYLAEHPRADEPKAPLFPGTTLTRPRPTGVPATVPAPGAATTGAEDTAPKATAKARARRQADALADLTVAEAEKRLVLDWAKPLRHATFYKAVYRPAVLRANRLTPRSWTQTSRSTRCGTRMRACAK
jgi:integrase